MKKYHPGHKFSAKQRTTDVLTEEKVDFESLLLSPSLIKGLTDSGFEKPSPIQLKAIPLGRCGLDLIAQAKSGTGKTCVFSVIALESINTDTKATQVLILAPTREIAVQVKDVVNAIGCRIKDLNCQVFIGGLPLDEDKKALKGCHIAVGSPGRVKYLIENGFLKTESVRMFILDEADKLLDGNFQEQINWIYSTLPATKQMMAFSATYPENVANHLTRYMREPTFVRLNTADPTLQGIKQFYCIVPFHHLPHKVFQEKVDQLVKLLSKVSFHQCLLFSNYQIRAQSLSSTLCAKGWPATFIAGSQTQQKRLQAMEKLKEFKCRILISTDLTARGIDAENVNFVVNMDIPRDGETYLHRIGRAGRFGTKGVAVTFVAKGKEQKDLKELEKTIGISMEALPESIPESLMVSETPLSDGKVQENGATIEVNVLRKNPASAMTLSTLELNKTKNELSTCQDQKDDINKEVVTSEIDASVIQLDQQTAIQHGKQEENTYKSIGLPNIRNGSRENNTKIHEHEKDEETSINTIFPVQIKDKIANGFDKRTDKGTKNETANMDTLSNSKRLESDDNDNGLLRLSENINKEVNKISKNAIEYSEGDETIRHTASLTDQRKLVLPSVEEFEKDFEEYLAWTNSFQISSKQENDDMIESCTDVNKNNHQKINKEIIIQGSCLDDQSHPESQSKRKDWAHSTNVVTSLNDDNLNVGAENNEERTLNGDNSDGYVGHCVDDSDSSNDYGDDCVKSEENCNKDVANGSDLNEDTYSDEHTSSESDNDENNASSDDDTNETSDDSTDASNDQHSIVREDGNNSDEHKVNFDYNNKLDFHQADSKGKLKDKCTSDAQGIFQSKLQFDSQSADINTRHCVDDDTIIHSLNNRSSHADYSNEVYRSAPLKHQSYYNDSYCYENDPGVVSERSRQQHCYSDVSSTLEDHFSAYKSIPFQQHSHGYMPAANNDRQDDNDHYFYQPRMLNSHLNSRHTHFNANNIASPVDLQWRKTWYNAFHTINRTIAQFASRNFNQ